MLASIYRLFAHEVYVLSPDQISADKRQHINLLDALNNAHNIKIFLFASIVIFGMLGVALWLKSKPIFKKIGHQIDKAGIIAPDIIRIAFGLALIFSARHKALFGPELPLHSISGGSILQPIILIAGVMLVIGLATRLFAFIALLVWLYALFTQGWYILTYTNYLGEAIATMLMPVQFLSVDRLIKKFKKLPNILSNYKEELAMPAARIMFGFALLFTAINIKVLQPALTLDTVNRYNLTRVFPFEPLFVVLGAALNEVLIAFLYMAGLLQRFTTVIFIVFLVASVLFFKEEVWPHYLLIALGIGIFLHPADKFALDRYLFAGKQKSKK